MSEPDKQNMEEDMVEPLIDDEGGIDLPESGQEQDGGEESVADNEENPVSEEGDQEVNEEVSGQTELEKYKEIAARSQADLENYRKRMARDRTEAIQYANFSLLSSLLPVIDNFEMGLKAARNEGEQSVIYQGMVMVQKQLHDFLR